MMEELLKAVLESGGKPVSITMTYKEYEALSIQLIRACINFGFDTGVVTLSIDKIPVDTTTPDYPQCFEV